MAALIIAYDIPGSSYTAFFGAAKDHRKERAVRRFLVDGNDRKDKLAILSDVVALVDDASSKHLYPNQSMSTDSFLPMQEATIQRVGTKSTHANSLLWMVEITYYYPF